MAIRNSTYHEGCTWDFKIVGGHLFLEISNVCDHDTLTSRTEGQTVRRTDRRLAVAIPRSV